jgi:hypothetical protein
MLAKAEKSEQEDGVAALNVFLFFISPAPVDNGCRFRLRLHPTTIVHYYRHSWQEKTVLPPTRKVNGDNIDPLFLNI